MVACLSAVQTEASAATLAALLQPKLGGSSSSSSIRRSTTGPDKSSVSVLGPEDPRLVARNRHGHTALRKCGIRWSTAVFAPRRITCIYHSRVFFADALVSLRLPPVLLLRLPLPLLLVFHQPGRVLLFAPGVVLMGLPVTVLLVLWFIPTRFFYPKGFCIAVVVVVYTSLTEVALFLCPSDLDG